MEGQKTRVLIVDDLAEKLLAYETILEELELDLIKARSGNEALKHVLLHDFAVILLDVNMPGMDGFETAEYIRKRKQSALTPIIFMTAFADEMRAAQGYALGAVDFILTPVVPEILRAKVKVFVDLFRMTQQVERQAEERIVLAEERMKRAAAEESNRVLEFLARAGAVLGNSLDYETTLRDVARLPVPFLADEADVVLADGPNEPQRIVSVGSENEVRILDETAMKTRFADNQLKAIERVFSTATAQFAAQPAAGADADPSFIVLPLRARGRTFGVFVLSRVTTRRRFGPADFSAADTFASRAGVALDNAQLYNDVQQADRQKNDFLSMLAHELRNPLAPIRNAVELMRLGVDDRDRMSWACSLIDRQVCHMVRLVDDLLDVSRITRGKIRLQMQSVDVVQIAAHAVESSRSVIDARRHRLAVVLPEHPLWVNGDPNRLEQVVTNLLNNAAKYSDVEGQILLSVELEPDWAVLRVRDQGVGIPSNMLKAIFDLFTQVDRSIDRSEGGLGIGLTLVHRIIEMHGGRIEAFSDGPGAGSEFVIRIPRATAMKPDTSSECEPSKLAETAAGKRILVVDDNVDAAESLAMLLRLRGHEVLQAHEGRSALDMARQFRPEIVVLDIGLPNMHGYEVARRLRGHPDTGSALLIAVTGYGHELDVIQSRAAGIDHHFIKPVNWEQLCHVLSNSQSVGEFSETN